MTPPHSAQPATSDTQHASRFTFHVSRFTHHPSLIYLLSLAILLVPAIQPLLTSDFTCGYDNVFHLWRSVQIEHLLRQGILFSRWAPDMALGLGFPLFVFLSPASAYVAALAHLAGLSWPLAINAAFALGLALGGLFMFLLARDLFGPAAGLVAAVAYIYAPYQAYEVFNRGSLSEALAWAFPPLVLWAVQRWAVRRDRRFFALGVLSLAGLILTHHLFAFLFAPLLVGWVLLAGYLAHDVKVTLRGAALGFLALGLSAFFWLPGLAERNWVQTGRLLGTWVFDYRQNFLTTMELCALPRATDPALINDWPPKALGLLPALIALLPLLRWRSIGRTARWQMGLLLASTAGAALMTLPISLPLWDHLPLLAYVQFPWRFLGPAAFGAALLAGLGQGSGTRDQGPGAGDQGPETNLQPPTSNFQLPTILLITLLIVGNLGWFYPDHCTPPKRISVAEMIRWEGLTHTLGTTAKREYLPVWAQRLPEESLLAAAYAAGGPIVRLPEENLPAGTHVLHADYGSLDATIALESPLPFRARYLALYYPGWRVTVDGHPLPVAPSDPDGLVSFDVPAGSHTIRVRFGETPLRLAADILSLLSLAALLLLPCPRIMHHALRIVHRASRITRHELALILITLSFLVAFSLNLSPYLRGPAEWRWTYAVPSSPGRLGIPAVSLVLYLMLTLVWIRQATKGTGVARWLSALLLLALVLAVPTIQASLLAVGQSDVLQPLFYRTVSPGASGVFSVGSTIEDPGDFLRRYPALMPTFPVHPQRYPPGLPLLFYVARRWLEKMPVLADRLGFALRLYQCHDLALMRLSNATIASALVQMALPLISGFTLLPLYGLARLAYGRQAAAWAAALYPLVSSFALWSGRWEQFYPLLTCTSWYFFYLGLTHPYAGRLGSLLRCAVLLVAGFVLSIASLLSFGMLALLLPMGIFAFVWLLTHPEHHRHRWAEWVAGALAFLTGLAALWIAYQLAFGTGFLDIWRVSMSLHLGLNRSYWTWVGYHLYDFFTFLGLPLVLLFLIALVGAIRDLGRRRYDALALGIALGLLLLDLSGTSRGEVARVWLFLTPLAMLVAARGLVRLRLGKRGFAIVAFLLALQLFTFNAFLRIVTTGLTDPPPHARVFELPAIAHPLSARFGDPAPDAYPIALLGYDLQPDTLLPGDVLHLTLYWQPRQPIARPYTVFTHVVGANNYLAGQQDNMPLTNTLPTTCWVPGEIVADPYNIPIAMQATPGDYVVETGFYILETGERLSTSGSTATPDGRVILQTISVGAERSR